MTNRPSRTAYIIIACIVILLLGMTGLEQYRIYAAANNVLKITLVSEDSRAQYERHELPELPCQYTFPTREDRLFAILRMERPSSAIKVEIRYRTDGEIRIWPMPEPSQKHLSRNTKTEDTCQFEAIEQLVYDMEYVIEGEANKTIELLSCRAYPLTAQQTPQALTRWNLALIIILIVMACPIYWLLHANRSRSEWFLAGLSLFFLAVIDWRFLGLWLAVCFVVFGLRRHLARTGSRRRLLLLTLLLVLVAIFAIFKYAPEVYYSLFARLGVLPLGLSYFVFRLVHLVMEWYRGMERDLTLREYLCYIFFFPAVSAGPIELCSNFRSNRIVRFSRPIFLAAIARIFIGVVKKTFVVNFLLAELLFKSDLGVWNQILLAPDAVGYGTLLSGLILFLLYGYIDFSAYSDIAIGLGLLFGREVCENFNWPIFSRNMAEFWKRYHISLGYWVQRHVYFPTLMSYRNTALAIILTFLTIGLWHHANVNWLVWSIHHAIGVIVVLALDEWGLLRAKGATLPHWMKATWSVIAIVLTLLYAAAPMAIIHVADLDTALAIYKRFFSFH